MSKFKKSNSLASSILLLIIVLLSINGMDFSFGQVYMNQVNISISGLPPIYQTKVYVNDTFVDLVAGMGTITIGFNSSTKVSVEPYVPSGYPYQPYPTYGMQIGFEGISFACYPNSRVFNSNTSYTFHYHPLYFLLVTSTHGTPKGSGWHAAGTWARIDVIAPDSESEDSRYVFDYWNGGEFRDDSSQASNAILMNGPEMVTANWKNQYYLSLDSEYTSPTGSGWYDEGSIAEISVETPIEIDSKVQVIFENWAGDFEGSDPEGEVVMDRAKSIFVNWKKQFYLQVNANEGEIDEESQWIDVDKQITLTAISPSDVIENESRIVFSRWTEFPDVKGPTVTIRMDRSKTITANWKSQFYLSIDSSLGDIIGEEWYNEEAIAEISVSPSYVPMDVFGYFGIGHEFSHWSGDVDATTINTNILMNGPKNVVVVWKLSYIRFTILLIIILSVLAFLIWKRTSIYEWLKKKPRKKEH